MLPREEVAMNESRRLAEFLANRPSRLAAMREALKKRQEESRDICFKLQSDVLSIQTRTLLTREEVKELGEDERSQVYEAKPVAYLDVHSLSLKNPTKEDWKTFTDVLKSRSDSWVKLKNDARRIWWEYRGRPMDPETRYSLVVIEWAYDVINFYSLPCSDNFRIARVGECKMRRRYQKAKENGCCGSIDVERVCPLDLNAYWIGCNYGH